MGYALPLMQWLLRTISPYSAPDCPTFLENLCTLNVELSPRVEHYASPDDISRTTITVYFRDVIVMKSCPDLSPNQLMNIIPCGIETTLIRKEITNPLMRCPVFVFCTPLLMVSPMANF
ncbi:hypothetical protein TNCV_124931 [Trichonephila clavipes]|nr:hypothetical protein TNCV_124931 [Trichonephila clavipes]